MFGIDARTARVVWTAALVIAGLYGVYLVRTTLLVMLIAVLFSYLIYPLFVQAQRRVGGRIPRTPLLCLVYLVVIALVALAVGLFGNQVAEQATTLAHQLPTLLDPATLEKRLKSRAQDSDDIVQGRMKKSAEETSHWPEYDYVVVNDDLEASIALVKSILAAERAKRERLTGLTEFVTKLRAG